MDISLNIEAVNLNLQYCYIYEVSLDRQQYLMP
jgi:hypothetical protein